MTVADEALRALDLATAGLSHAKIAALLDVPVKDVKGLIKAGKKQDPRVPDADMDARRLDQLQGALWPLASKGDPDAIATMLKLMERRDSMNGIDGDLPAAVKATTKLQKANRAQVKAIAAFE